MKLKAIKLIDGYKTGHIYQYPEGTELVYSNFTPRTDRLAAHKSPEWDRKVVFFGLQGLVKWLLIDLFNDTFFKAAKDEVVADYARTMDAYLGPGLVTPEHIAALHDLGYLPIEIKALPEGSRVDIGVPLFTIKNTKPEFFWLTNYLETLLSAEAWKSSNNATVAFEYRRLLEKFAKETGAPLDFVLWQGHDFSMRGMSGVYDAAQSGAGHLLSFLGTDTIPAIDYLEEYYGGKSTFVGGSVPATEHSVMCMGGKETEVETFRRLITKVVPSGVVSIVSDTWDFWKVITEYAAELKDEILARQPNALGLAKVVFRPDSGDPVDILCGTAIPVATYSDVLHLKPGDIAVTPDGTYLKIGNYGEYKIDNPTPEMKGAVECLWDLFGGTQTEKGYKVLNQRVGLIYGDSITLARAEEIMSRLKAKGFASCNSVFGIGSYTYQYATRDTYGMAMKATFGIVNGEVRELFKDPVTDSGTKKSARGLLRVEAEGGRFVLHDQQTPDQEAQGELKTVFKDGKLVKETTLEEVRATLASYL